MFLNKIFHKKLKQTGFVLDLKNCFGAKQHLYIHKHFLSKYPKFFSVSECPSYNTFFKSISLMIEVKKINSNQKNKLIPQKINYLQKLL